MKSSFVLLLMGMVCGLGYGFAGGNGSQASPYQITTAAHLQAVNNNLSASYRLMNNINLAGTTYSAAPIAFDTNPGSTTFSGTAFTGSFDGQGYVIRNLHVNASSSHYIGLFGHVGSGGVVSNLTLQGVNNSGNYRTGGLVGYAGSGSTVIGCSVSGSISGGARVGGLIGDAYIAAVSGSHTTVTVNGTERVGGLIGHSSTNVVIDNCSAGGTISATGHSAGGLLGRNHYAVSISNSSSTCTVTAGGLRAGGLIGWSSGSDISNCSASGHVTGVAHVGGLIGHQYLGSVSGSTASGDVQQTGEEFAGGLIGFLDRSSADNCHATGDVTGTSAVGGLVGRSDISGVTNCSSEGGVSGNANVGGLVGYVFRGYVFDSHSSSQATGVEYVGGLIGYSDRDVNINTCYATGVVYASDHSAGGLIGRSLYGRTITGSHATGAVTAVNLNAGGLVGDISGARIFNCRAEGAVIGGERVGGLTGNNFRGLVVDSHATGDVTGGNDYTGGLAGQSNRTIIDNCYATGTVFGERARVGGLVGNNHIGQIYNSFATGNVSANGDFGSDGAAMYVGGLVGQHHTGVVENCYATGSVSAPGNNRVGGLVGNNYEGWVIDSHASGSVSGRAEVGGLLGYNQGSGDNPDTGYIGIDSFTVGSYATGDVTGSVEFIGGLAGRNLRGTIENCYAFGSVSGGTEVGGLVGRISGDGIVRRCYSTGSVTGTSSVGGLIGASWGTTLLSVWDRQASGSSTSAGGSSRTTAQMMSPMTFIGLGWDYDHVWSQYAAHYPVLSWQGLAADVNRDGVVDFADFVLLAGSWLKSWPDIEGVPSRSITNPYQGVDWSTFNQYRAALHNHTTQSDGSHTVAELIDHYHSYGFDILSITDHDNCCPNKVWSNACPQPTWPWTDFGRNPNQLGMLAVKGNEITRGHHVVSLFNDYGDGAQQSTEAAIVEIGNRNGLAFLAHPIWSNHKGGRGLPAGMEWTPELYAYFLTEYSHLLGVEVRDWTSRYNEELWDQVLSLTMPEHPVWGFNVDDTHAPDQVAYEWTTFLMPVLSEPHLRYAMINGRFFFTDTQKPNGQVPTITSIDVNQNAGTITIHANDYEQIVWISEGRQVHTGPTFTIGGVHADKYVRARVYGLEGATYTQPFGIVNPCAYLYENRQNFSADITLDCAVEMSDLSIFADQWLTEWVLQ